jgi:hypothetical protein
VGAGHGGLLWVGFSGANRPAGSGADRLLG